MSTDKEQQTFELGSLPRPSDELRSKEAYIAISLHRVPPEVVKTEILHLVDPEDKNQQFAIKLKLDTYANHQAFGFSIEQATYFATKMGDAHFDHPIDDIWFTSESENPEIFEKGQQARAIIRELISTIIAPVETTETES